MNGFDRLELSTETIHELDDDELKQVAGGVTQPTTTVQTTILRGPTGRTSANCYMAGA